MPAYQLHDERLPRRVHPHCVRQLLRQRDGGQQAHQPRAVGYGGTGGLRQTQAAVISTDGEIKALVFHVTHCSHSRSSLL